VGRIVSSHQEPGTAVTDARQEVSWEEFADRLATAGRPAEPSQRFKDDQRWLLDHLNELVVQYAGQWVIVYGQQVVAASPDLGLARKMAARRVGTEQGLVMMFMADEQYVFYGGGEACE